MRQWREQNPGYMSRYCRDWNDARDPSREDRREQKLRDSRWTAEEDQYLGMDTDSEVARALGRSTRGVETRRRRLGIPAHIARGRRYTQKGYVTIVLAPDDPMIEMTRSNRTVQEHRLVMARNLGRPLTRDEVVHHRNGIKDDNKISNLELWTRSHPDGQRVEDVYEWCLTFIERYEGELKADTTVCFKPS